MLVAVTIFTLVIGSATGLFVSAVRSQAKALAAQKLLDETSYVMEYMSRALRMAKKELSVPPACLTDVGYGYNYQVNAGADKITFINYQGVCQEFYLDGTQLKERKADVLELTSDKLKITSLRFNVSGAAAAQPPADYLQPMVTISMIIEKAGPEIKIQTTISQRNLDVQR